MKNTIKFIIGLILFFTFQETESQTKYVDVNGSGSACTIGSPCSLSYAFANCEAGETWYVKAGDYGDTTHRIQQSGTSSQPITFIGYRVTPGDIDSDAETTVTQGATTITRPLAFWHSTKGSSTYGQTYNASSMPLIKNRLGVEHGNGHCLRIDANYIVMKNFQFYGNRRALNNFGNNNDFENIYTFEQNFGGANEGFRWGNSINEFGDNNSWNNVVVFNADNQGFSIYGSNNTYNNIAVFCDTSQNSTDYYYLFNTVDGDSSSGNESTNIFVGRIGDLVHRGHGIVWKTPYPNFNNNVTGFIVDNSNLEIQFPGVHNNTAKNGYVINREYPDNNNAWNRHGGSFANGAYDCHIEDVIFENCGPIFQDWNDGRSGDVADSADGFTFNRVIIINGRYGIAGGYFDGHQTNNWNGHFDNNKFYNCVFYNNENFFVDNRNNSGTEFINSIVYSVPRFKATGCGYCPSWNLNASWDNNAFFGNGFSALGSNTYNVDPQFTDPANYDFSLQPTSTLKGQGVATPFMSAGNDIGAQQEGSVTPPTPTCSDGIQNGDETGVDCGGSCSACPPVTNPPTELLFSNVNSRIVYVDENTVNPSFQMTTVDADAGDTFVYTKEFDETGAANAGPDPSLFSISGNILTLNITPDFENPVDSNTNNIYALNVRTTDSQGNFFIEDMVIIINNLDDDGVNEDVTPPTIVSQNSIVTNNSIDFTYSTNELSKSQIRVYESDVQNAISSDLVNTFNFNHNHSVNGLSSSTVYSLDAYVEDSTGNGEWITITTFTTEDDPVIVVPNIETLGKKTPVKTKN